MANHKWDGGKLVYSIPKGAEDGAAAVLSLDVDALPDAVKRAAMLFGFQTAARNSTAGLFTEEPKTAAGRMAARFKAWAEGVWKAASTGGEGERATSMLAQAVAEAGGITPEEAATIISDLIESKVTEAGLSADEDDDKPAIRKIGAAVRASFSELPEVAQPLARIKAEAALARSEAANKAAAEAKAKAEPGAPKLADLLKK